MAQDDIYDESFEDFEDEGEHLEVAESFEDDGYIDVVIPEVEDEEDDRSWYSHLPADHAGVLDWEDLIYIGGQLPNTTLSRRAMMLVPKKMKKDALLALKESRDNLLRLCITHIGDKRLNHTDLRGDKLDRHLSYKQQQLIAAYFEQLTDASEDEVEAFLAMTRHGRKRST